MQPQMASDTMNQFPYGNDLKKVREWIGREESLSNTWHIQYLGGSASLDDCEFHFLLHGMDNLVSAHCVLTGRGLGLPIGPRGVSLPRTVRDVREVISDEIKQDFEQQRESAETTNSISRPFLDRVSNEAVWNGCYYLGDQRQWMTRTTETPFSLADLRDYRTRVEVVASSFIFVEFETLSFQFPRSEQDNLQPSEMGGHKRVFISRQHSRWL